MTSKKELLYMIELLRGDLLELENEVDLLRGAVDSHSDILIAMNAKRPRKVKKACVCPKKCEKKPVKRGRGRPRKNA